MTQPDPAETDVPPADPSAAIEHAYQLQRARRRVRERRRRGKRVAGVRFYVVLMALVFASVVIGLTVWNEIQRLFGL